MDLVARSTGVPLTPGNSFRILRDGRENYPAWEQAIRDARRSIHVEMYIVHADRTGTRFRDLLVERARAGIDVRILCDWFGCLRLWLTRFWRPLTLAGGEVRYANPPHIDSLFRLASRDHRKLLVIDAEVAFVSGLCVGDAWVGDPARGVPPWRDTGCEIRGPAVADAHAVFASAWDQWGTPLPPALVAVHDDVPMVGATSTAVIGTDPERTSLYRLELVVTSLARHRLWLTDAYFMATSTYLEALVTAAASGVDVRLLVPGNSDIGWIANVSRLMYRRLLEAGVRVFEWNGSMVHAKTAVADGRLVRIGSTNLNLSSWVGNWELDGIVSDEAVGALMEAHYLEDLSHATEVVLTTRRRVRLVAGRGRLPRGRKHRMRSSAGRAMADLGFVRSTLGAAVKGHRVLGADEAWSIVLFGAAALGLAILGWFVPAAVAYPIAVLLGVEGVLLIWKGARLRWRGPRDRGASGDPAAGGPADRAAAGRAPDGRIAAATREGPGG